MVQSWLAAESKRLDKKCLEDISDREGWEAARSRYREEYLYMLGLSPLPEKTPLEATVTGRLERDGYVVEKLHYQSRPGLYVTANLYKPPRVGRGVRLPAVLYVCGHAGRGRNGNKTAYQSHGIWFARHGYVCLMLDTLQLGEISGIHHGTYREERWWWLSRGYTPAGVECWNGVRGIDYLQSLPSVDPDRIAVTGISGGGAATFWIAAADERVRVAVPVSGMADLESYVSNRVINGHCDCMFLHNTFRWPWTRIAALVAPRPLLFVNSHQDRIFPMDANERVANRLEMLYAFFGAGDRFDTVVSLGGHAYREDIRKAAFRWINAWMEGDAREILDSEVDLVEEREGKRIYPIPMAELRVFPRDSDIPSNQRNTTADQWFVPLARVKPPTESGFGEWRDSLLSELRRVSFRAIPERVPPAAIVERTSTSHGNFLRLETEPGIRVAGVEVSSGGESPERVFIVVDPAGQEGDEGDALHLELRKSLGDIPGDHDSVVLVSPRGYGETRWTRRNPPNYVERSHVLLGTTVDTGRIRDVASTARAWRDAARTAKLWVVARGPDAVLAACAALLEETIDGAILIDPPASLMEKDAPRILNALRVCDVPDLLGMLAPRPLKIRAQAPAIVQRVRASYAAAGAEEALEVLGR